MLRANLDKISIAILQVPEVTTANRAAAFHKYVQRVEDLTKHLKNEKCSTVKKTVTVTFKPHAHYSVKCLIKLCHYS